MERVLSLQKQADQYTFAFEVERRVTRTGRGYLGLAPLGACEGDIVSLTWVQSTVYLAA